MHEVVSSRMYVLGIVVAVVMLLTVKEPERGATEEKQHRTVYECVRVCECMSRSTHE